MPYQVDRCVHGQPTSAYCDACYTAMATDSESASQLTPTDTGTLKQSAQGVIAGIAGMMAATDPQAMHILSTPQYAGYDLVEATAYAYGSLEQEQALRRFEPQGLPAIEYTPEPTVEPWLQAGSDAMVVAAARVSTSRDTLTMLNEAAKMGTDLRPKDKALLSSLMHDRHAGPFYHGTLAVYIDTTLFVWQQIGTHPELRRSRESARYRTLRPRFYVPRYERAMMVPDNFVAMRPQFDSAEQRTYEAVVEQLCYSYAEAWQRYKSLKALGVAKEVARGVLPAAIMSTGIVSGRPLDWLRALSVRTQTPHSKRVSHVQAETAEVFMVVDRIMRDYWPLTMQAFDEAGRVAP